MSRCGVGSLAWVWCGISGVGVVWDLRRGCGVGSQARAREWPRAGLDMQMHAALLAHLAPTHSPCLGVRRKLRFGRIDLPL